ncbi:MAG: phage tail tape measure protein [Alphaproteobacteria bacterium]|nr:phage tail tape measure protein [Alphaproteobacteria bacterium]
MSGGFDPTGFRAGLQEAEQALAQFAQGPARAAADDVAESFERAGKRIAATLGRAGSDGEASLKRLAKIILEELAKIALGALARGGSLPFFGARAVGGAVTSGGAYLVGERGPELFTPHNAGAIGQGGGSVNVHFHLGDGADMTGVMRHQGQIAAQIARAVAYGRRNL